MVTGRLPLHVKNSKAEMKKMWRVSLKAVAEVFLIRWKILSIIAVSGEVCGFLYWVNVSPLCKMKLSSWRLNSHLSSHPTSYIKMACAYLEGGNTTFPCYFTRCCEDHIPASLFLQLCFPFHLTSLLLPSPRIVGMYLFPLFLMFIGLISFSYQFLCFWESSFSFSCHWLHFLASWQR